METTEFILGEKELRENLLAALGEAKAKEVMEALDYAKSAHAGQNRVSGEPYATHPIAVAAKALSLGLDAECLKAALLHDVIEDCKKTKEEIEARFGRRCAEIVESLTKAAKAKLPMGSRREEKSAEAVRKMILAMSRDARVVLIKLCDRWHNMKTIQALDPARRRAIALETKEVYAPLASRLGLNEMRDELLEMTFGAGYPWRAKVISAHLEKSRSHRREFVEKEIGRITAALEAEGISAVVTGRRKKTHSVFEKMREKNLSLRNVLDKDGFRIIVENRKECYAAVGVLHELYKPIPGFFKDYIALPKLNGYQSIHTALMDKNGQPLEAQIRSKEMDRLAMHGIASHWVYKEKSPTQEEEGWLWLQSLLDIHGASGHPEDFLEHVRTDLFSDEIYCFTPKGDVLALPRGASVLDFAYAIHSDVGARTFRALVNQEPKEISWRLKNGDRVDIETAPEPQIQRRWLSCAKTGRARAKIREFLRGMEPREAIALGEKLLEQSLKIAAPDQVAEALQADFRGWALLKKSSGKSREEALSQIATGVFDPMRAASLLFTGRKCKESEGMEAPALINGEEGPFLKFAKCCNALPPDEIEGVLRPGLGLEIHKKGCEEGIRRRSAGKAKTVAVGWEAEALSRSFSAELKVRSRNQRGALSQIAQAVSEAAADINNIRVQGNSIQDGSALIDLEVQIKSQAHMERVLENLAKCPAVVNVF